jgi:hypothetical protein
MILLMPFDNIIAPDITCAIEKSEIILKYICYYCKFSNNKMKFQFPNGGSFFWILTLCFGHYKMGGIRSSVYRKAICFDFVFLG